MTKCLEKDRRRRYETADVPRFLVCEPIVARPPSASYRFQKLVRGIDTFNLPPTNHFA